MGSGSSRPRSRPTSPPVTRSPSRILSSIICGGSSSSSSSSSSRAATEMEGRRRYEMLKSNVEDGEAGAGKIQGHVVQSSAMIGSGTVSADSDGGGGGVGYSLMGSSVTEVKSIVGEVGLRNSGTSNHERRFSGSLELVSSQVRDECSYDDSFRNRYSGGEEASTSFREHQQSSDAVSVNALANAVNGIDNPESSRGVHGESSSQASSFDRSSVENHHLDGMTTWPLHSSGPVQDANPEGSGLPVREHAHQDDGDVLHVDVVSISSSIFSRGTADAIGHRETRRNSRRLFWDAFSRRSSWRPIDSPTIVLSSDDSPDDLQSHDRWLLDFSGDFFGDGSDAGFLGSRIRSWTDRRRQSRSEVWERLIGGLDDDDRRSATTRTTVCPSGLHPDGTCSCESLLSGGESSTRASISRIVMLAEALFEVVVLDEIHRQPSSFPPSIVSLPATESVVNSFPLKNHKKLDSFIDGEEPEQCYICLSEYEEGEKIRVLPCHHEYHMSCVDKWLKEIHGVCPLCRGDVRQGDTELSAPASEIMRSI